jgi:hypothetical protein
MTNKKVSTLESNQTTITQPVWLALVRVALGIVLFYKGFVFIRNIAELESLINQTGIGVFTSRDSMFALVVTFLTLLCGFFYYSWSFHKICICHSDPNHVCSNPVC